MNGLGKVTEFRDYCKFRINLLTCLFRLNPLLVGAGAEKGCRLCRYRSVRFFVANNLNLIYNKYALRVNLKPHSCPVSVLLSSQFVRNFTTRLERTRQIFR